MAIMALKMFGRELLSMANAFLKDSTVCDSCRREAVDITRCGCLTVELCEECREDWREKGGIFICESCEGTEHEACEKVSCVLCREEVCGKCAMRISCESGFGRKGCVRSEHFECGERVVDRFLHVRWSVVCVGNERRMRRISRDVNARSLKLEIVVRRIR